MSNAVTSKTFFNRLNKCYYYKEKNTYIKYINILFNKLLKEYKNYKHSFLKLFSDKFSAYSYTGVRFIYKNDRKAYKQCCINNATKLNKFITSKSLINIMDEVIYKDKVKCYVGAVIANKNINVYFSFINDMLPEKELDYFLFNNYIYNEVRGYKNDCLVYNVPNDLFLLIKYGDNTYTIIRNFLKTIIRNKARRQGEHCNNCKLRCKPKVIVGQSRLDTLI